MKNFQLTFSALLIGLVLFVSGCKDDDDDDKKTSSPKATSGDVTLMFEHVWGSNMLPFDLNEQVVHPKTGDTLTYSMFRYYISNIMLEKADGEKWIQEESYHLIDLSEPTSLMIKLEDIPNGDYTQLHYTFGVDSTRNVSGAQVGALDPANGMFWSWNSGYIMVKAEGTSPNSSTGDFAFHLGGFSGTNNVVTERSSALSTTIEVSGDDNASMIHLMVNPARFWHTVDGLTTVSKIHMPNATATQMGQDFANGINVGMVHN